MESSSGTDHNPDWSEIEGMISNLSLEEKVGQLVGTYVGSMTEDRSLEDAKRLIREDAVGTVAAFGNGVSWHNKPKAVIEIANELQRIATEETNHGIPLLIPVDAVHGHAYVHQATIFPHPLGMAATRNSQLVERASEVTGTEIRATGATLNYGPTADVALDSRWGRVSETFGESSHMCAELTRASVRGQERGTPRVATTMKHFPAYGDPVGGEDAAPVDRSLRDIYRVFLPPFEAAIDEGVSAAMPCYNSIGGEPAHGSYRILTELLRERLGFDGPVVSDWGGIDMLSDDHRVVPTQLDAAKRSIRAGLDQISIGGSAHAEHLYTLVNDEEIPTRRLDESVTRILQLKWELGLFDDPYVDLEVSKQIIGASEHKRVARDAARASQTLLKNEADLLPLSPDIDSILVTGPNADNFLHQIGGWSVPNRLNSEGTTLLEGIEQVVDATVDIVYEPGTQIREPVDISAAERAAEKVDVAVVALGENWYLHEFGPESISGPTGEFPTRTDISLPVAQRDLLRSIINTGTPTILTMISGRLLSIPWAAEHVPSIVQSYYPGGDGGLAIAEVLFGEHNPAGRLPLSIPRSAGQLPDQLEYLRHPTPIGEKEHPPSYDPLFSFGHGLHYTEFSFGELTVDNALIGPAADVTATMEVKNIGERESDIALDLYLTDEVSSFVRPEREHVGFERIRVAPGETETVEFEVRNELLGVVNAAGRREVESGEFTLTCENRSARFEVQSVY